MGATSSHLTSFANFFDYLVKGIIALILMVAGFLFQDIHSDVKEAKISLQDKEVRIKVLETNSLSVEKKLDKIDTKIDLLIREVKR